MRRCADGSQANFDLRSPGGLSLRKQLTLSQQTVCPMWAAVSTLTAAKRHGTKPDCGLAKAQIVPLSTMIWKQRLQAIALDAATTFRHC